MTRPRKVIAIVIASIGLLATAGCAPALQLVPPLGDDEVIQQNAEPAAFVAYAQGDPAANSLQLTLLYLARNKEEQPATVRVSLHRVDGQLVQEGSTTDDGEILFADLTEPRYVVRVWLRDRHDRWDIRPSNLRAPYDLRYTLRPGSYRILFATSIWHLVDDLRWALEFHWEIPPVSLVYPKRDNQVLCPHQAFFCAPNPNRNRPAMIFLDYNARSAVLHELAHAAMYRAYGSLPSGACPFFHNIWQRVSETCAWVEGWADFAVLAITNSSIYTYPTGRRIGFENLRWPIRQRPPKPTDLYAMEGYVAAALWDLYDGDRDGVIDDDGVQIPWEAMWTAFRSARAPSLRRYLEALAQSGYAEEVDTVLAVNGFAPLR